MTVTKYRFNMTSNMDSFISRVISSGENTLRIECGQISPQTTYEVSGYQDSSYVLVSAYFTEEYNPVCIAYKNGQVFRTQLRGTDNRSYGLAVTFDTNGNVKLNGTAGNISGRIQCYIIIGFP